MEQDQWCWEEGEQNQNTTVQLDPNEQINDQPIRGMKLLFNIY